MKLTDKDKHDRPREKLRAKGAAALTDLELLAAIIGSGNKEHDVVSIAADLQKLLKETLTQNTRLDYPALSAVPGMGEAKICELLAAFELAHRYPPPVSEAPILDTTEKIIAQFAAIRAKKQEHFACLTLDGASRLINNRIIAIGTLDATLVHPREVFADAIADRAAAIIVAHNHPGGSLIASVADREVTRRLAEAGHLLGIRLADHFIVTANAHISIL